MHQWAEYAEKNHRRGQIYWKKEKKNSYISQLPSDLSTSGEYALYITNNHWKEREREERLIE